MRIHRNVERADNGACENFAIGRPMVQYDREPL
jgi:hypothetical protein